MNIYVLLNTMLFNLLLKTYHLSTKSMASSENFPFGNEGGGWKDNYILVSILRHLLYIFECRRTINKDFPIYRRSVDDLQDV